MTVVLVLAAAFLNLLFLSYVGQPPSQKELFESLINSFEKNFSAPSASAEMQAFIDDKAFANDEQINFMVVESSYLLNSNNPLSNILPTRDGLLIYKIQAGDNLSKIAASFGISLNTIFWANPNLKANLIAPGQEIIILPVSGTLHQIQPGETLDSIASQYSADAKKILQFNPSIAKGFEGGETIIIPDAKPLRAPRLASLASLPDYPGYFAIPTTGWNWGRLHNYNAVDIANACGTPVYAAAEGLVIEEQSSGWNHGYGAYILIEHPNSTKTRYAHNQKNTVSVGDYVAKGDVIGYIGNTGNAHGPTGCHLHFEIIGAKNLFAK
jgi:murein DD-endopeptidase MepM/ murein hydrolase activator NlpD